MYNVNNYPENYTLIFQTRDIFNTKWADKLNEKKIRFHDELSEVKRINIDLKYLIIAIREFITRE